MQWYIRGLLPNVVLYSMSDSAWKLADFGVSSGGTRSYSTKSGRGSKAYRAPELQRDDTLSRQSDIWALSRIMLELTFPQPQYSPEDSDTGLKLLTFAYDRFNHLLQSHSPPSTDGIPLHTHNCGLPLLRSTETEHQVPTASCAGASRKYHLRGL
jgi:serine/threonine protein kinase